MASRQVNIYVNGQQVANQIKSITAEKQKLVRELARMVVGSEEYESKIRDIRKLDGIISTHKNKLRGIGEEYSKLSKFTDFLGVAGISLAAGQIVSSLVNVGKEMVTLYDTAAKTDAQLKAVLKSTNGIAGRSFEQLNAQAEELQKFTLFDDDATKAAQARLLTFTQVREDVFDAAIPLIQDYSTAMTQAGKSTGDLAEDANKVGKALQDPIKGITALSKSGVAFSEIQKQQIRDFVKVGDVASAQRIILEELAVEFGGSAKAAAAAGTGGYQIFQNRIDNIGESIGELIVNELNELSPAIDEAISGVEDFISAEKSGGEATTTFGKILQALANVFSFVVNIQDKAYEAGVRFRLFMLEKLGPASVEVARAFGGLYNTGVQLANFLNETAGIKKRFEPIDLDTFNKKLKENIAIAKQDLADLSRSAVPDGPAAPPKFTENSTNEETPGEKEAREKRAEARRKEAERELKDQQNKNKKLLEDLAKFKQDELLLTLSENDRRLAEIAAVYQKEIDEAKKLEESKNKEVAATALATRLELERLQADALAKERDKINQEELDQWTENETDKQQRQIERDLKFEEEKKKIYDDLKALSDEQFEARTDEELAKTQEKYDQLLELARAYGINVENIEKDAAKRKIDLQKEVNEKLKEQELELYLAQKDIQQAKLGLFTSVAEAIGQLASNNAAIAEAIFIFEKVAAIADILITGAKERATIRAKFAALELQAASNPITAALLPGLKALQIAELTKSKISTAAGVATVVGATIGHFAQKKEGGFASVRGADDGQVYHAKLIGQPSTGMLDYPHPVLTSSGILANEVGKEYYVSHTDLRNPRVLDHVRAIENITSHRQRAEGGFASTSPAANTTAEAPPNFANLERMISLNNALLAKLLSEGVMANIGNDELLAMQRQAEKLRQASGGRLG